MTLAAIWLQHGAPIERQIGVCLAYLQQQHYSMVTLAPLHGATDLLALARIGGISVVVVAFASRAAQALAVDLAGLARVESVRPTPMIIQPNVGQLAHLADLVMRWHQRGKPTREIAQLLEVDTQDISELIRRHGQHE